MNRGLSGTIVGPSAYFMKSPPIQYSDEEARIRTEAFIAGQEQEEPVSLPELHSVKVKG
jgi:myo-inositol-1-phosphate synthase